ncbi:MAG TPA: PAS domain-containing sensor histidine kinase [Acidimicrobiia bacterium]|nr:PAS domain-containing sensor histidine kinase [Acidimicrobiia bacterium]
MENPADSADNNEVTMLIGGIEELFRRLPVALYRSAPDGALLAANPALAELLGYDSVAQLTDDVGSVESFYVDRTSRELWLNRIAETGEVLDFDMELRRRDGSTVWVQDSARAVYDPAGTLVYCEGALIDMTEKVKARKSRDEFVATVSHELRNPIAVLLGLAQELAHDYQGFSDEERREVADVMARQADDASWIIEDLLVAYREDTSRVAAVTETFDVTGEILRVLEGVDEPIKFEPGENATMVVADPRRTRQILRNLVSNAVRYGGEKIVVTTRRGSENSIDILVRDSGAPLDPREAQRIFESYERGSGLLDAKSVGLGLSVARKLAALMNGYLVYEHDGDYSSFIVTLPAAP